MALFSAVKSAVAPMVRAVAAMNVAPAMAVAATRALSGEAAPIFDKVLIANRGEIAVRVMRTCQKLGIKTVAVHSEADTESLHVKMADEAVCIGPAPSAESYLIADHIVDACKMTGAQAVHPGFGFLSENCEFAERLENEGITFIGPPSNAIHVMGDKIISKDFANKAGVSTIPGILRIMKDEAECVEVAREIGYPVMIKASAGGGGKGMRIAFNDEEAAEGFRLSTEEAKSSFADDRIFVEKFIGDGRHIEIQVMSDKHGNHLYFPERECSIQRRNQKVVEESPSTHLSPEVRKAMGEQAAALAAACDYHGAGTVEMIVDQEQKFYFLEMNTRLQVEHPVTEYITGVDLVEQMIRAAAGLPLSITQEDLTIKGWATECRVYAEDPFKNFLPAIGRLNKYVEPFTENPDVRIDSGLYEGMEISMFYDPMICKLITYGEDRNASIDLMRKSLETYIIRGVGHNVPFLRSILDHPRYLAGDLCTDFIAQEYPDGFLGHVMTDKERTQLFATASVINYKRSQRANSVFGTKLNPAEAVEKHGDGTKAFTMKVGDAVSVVDVEELANDEFKVMIDGEAAAVKTAWSDGDVLCSAVVNGDDVVTQFVEGTAAGLKMLHVGNEHEVTILDDVQAELWSYLPEKIVFDTSKYVMAPMPGALISVNVEVGQEVDVGEEVCVLEAMKMSNVLRSETKGVVKAVKAQPGASVAADDVIVEFE